MFFLVWSAASWGETPAAAVGGLLSLSYSYWLAARRGVEHSWGKQTSSASVNQSGVATVLVSYPHWNFPIYSVEAWNIIGYKLDSYLIKDASLNYHFLIELGTLPVEKRSNGFAASIMSDAEHQCLVRLCGETQRLLEQLEPKVSTDFWWWRACLHSGKL